MSSARHRRSGGLAAPLAVATSTGAAALVAVLVVGGLQQGDGTPAPQSSASKSPDLVMVEPASGPSGSTPGRTGSGGSRSGAAATSAAAATTPVRVDAGYGTRPPSSAPPEPASTAAARTSRPAHPSHPAHPTQAATSPSRTAPSR
ncbi:MAG: hypothetical protein QOD68_2480 [Actinomycetota bacterium]|nr:hypothetical protein [Actinomycetota bacterium]